jgi:hypothetical protein
MSETILTKQDIEDLALGAAILGTGGGGDPYIGKLMALQTIEKGKRIRVVSPDDVEDDALIIPVAMMGTPTVVIEKLPSGKEALSTLNALERYFNRKAEYITPIEAGGLNSTIPLVVGAYTDRPVIDGDGMGRAFPELQMVTFHLYGVKATPMTMTDEKGNAVLLETIDNFWAEKIARVITVKFGGTAWIAIYPMLGHQYKKAVVRRATTYSIRIGRTLREAKAQGRNVIDALLDVTDGKLLFTGKMVDVVRRNVGGFARGEAVIEGLDEFNGSKLTIHFQNENLVAIKDDEIVASVPDLITVLDKDTARPITTERLRYGLRVNVIGMPCDEKWRSEEALKVIGPKYFGYDIEYSPLRGD